MRDTLQLGCPESRFTTTYIKFHNCSVMSMKRKLWRVIKISLISVSHVFISTKPLEFH